MLQFRSASDADDICKAVEAVSDDMAAAALQDLPQEDFYGDEGSDDDDETTPTGKSEKKKRSWLGKVGKGIYRRSVNLAKSSGLVDTPASKEDQDLLNAVMSCRSPFAVKVGGVGIQNPEHAKACRSVLSLMISQMGRNLLSGGNVMNVSFPIQCCQPRTVLEIGAQMGQFTHIYLPRAAVTKDPVERMKNVVACFIAAMPLTSGNFLKPLNPILGETLQVDYGDGSKLYMEQTCHHPPVSSFCLVPPSQSYTVSGHQTFNVGWGYNKMFLTNQGVRTVTFSDGGSISLDFPQDRWINVFWGDMVHQTIGTQTFTDENNGIRCRLEFGNPANRKGIPNDFFEGVIEQYDQKDPEAPGTALHQVQGSWLGFVDFDKTRYWDIRTTEKTPMSAPADMLKSDSRNRTDRKFLEAKDFKKAQAEKIRLEENQRHERRLREAVHGKH
uniref:Oxysterol-binding protein n=1 Tax=Hanusia phi TaxID=3032 RepID=A0A7S0EDB9_9CRYP|mmetsp:Transcript_2219/g.5146  ORF Transcript_2219/g.5146 Transcript_2219/m.5146 type:complete len:442 (+) Transcript_2219:157-1482(+)